MKTNFFTITQSESLAALSLRLIALVNLIFFAIFSLTLVFTVSLARAEAEDISCTGSNLLAQMTHDDPAALAAIRSEAAGIENGKGILWQISRENAEPSYLFGTMHMSDPRVLSLGSHAQAAFDTSSTIVIETTDVLDQSKIMAAMLANPELTMFTDETTLSSLIPEKDRAIFETALSARGIPLASIQKMKPWMLSAMVALPACELARKTSGALVLDTMLANEGISAGKTLGGLETIADQLGAMASLPLEFHISGLIGTLELGDQINDITETMIVLYQQEETGMFWPFFRAALPDKNDEGDAGFSDFEERMVTARNHTMAERAVPFIDAGGAFIAVGALHLPGAEGLVALLRKKGYQVEAIR